MNIKKRTPRSILGAMSRMQQGGIPNGPEATADVTRSPIIRELFEEVVKSARMSPEYRGLRSEMNSPINRGGSRILDEVRRQNINRAEKRLLDADIAGFRGAFPMDFDQTLVRTDPRRYNPDLDYKNFTDLVKSGDEDALQVLQVMDNLYRERYPTAVKRPVSEMFGVR